MTGKDYGQYHEDIWDLIESIQSTADIRIKYLADPELIQHLKDAINSLDKARSILKQKALQNQNPNLGAQSQ